jgi:hypothetical protein
MPLSTEEQALFDHARASVPRWLTTGKTAVLEWLHGFVKIFDPVRALAQVYLDGIYLDSATGRWLDAHARDRDTTRREDETDAVLRERIRQVEDAVTDLALQHGINTIIGAQIDISTDSAITIYDVDNTTHKVITIETGTYSASEIETLITSQLYPGWKFWFVNGRAYFDSRDEDGNSRVFNLVWSNSFIRLAFGFSAGATDWDVPNDGWYRSDIYPLDGFCAITHLRRDRAHMHGSDPGDPTAFLDRGYRMANSLTPMTYLVMLPVSSTATKAAVEEYLRQYGPAGYKFIVAYNP